MKLDIYLKAAQKLQAKALNIEDIYLFEIDTRHYEDGETALWVTTKLMDGEKFDYYTLYTFWREDQNDAVLARLTAWMRRIEREQKKRLEATGTARTLQPDAMQTTTI